MDIQFVNKSINVFQSSLQQFRRIQQTMEGVVPDINDDIGRIVSVQSSVLLKGKEAYHGRATISGEVQAVLLYITEEENQIAFVKLTKDFEMEYEHEEIHPDLACQIRLYIMNTEARVLNPRKVSVTAEIGGELSAFSRGNDVISTEAAEGGPEGLHIKEETTNAYFANLVTEKTFALSEQYVFPEQNPKPAQLISQNISFGSAELQQVGGRLILKGTVRVELYYLSSETPCPQKAVFTSPFSQIIDAGDALCTYGRTDIEVTSAYFDLMDTISGEKALDMELHAVAQISAYGEQQLQYISDLYSNMAPVVCQMRERELISGMHASTEVLNAAESVPLADDCADICCTFSTISALESGDGKLAATVALEILYLTREGRLASVRRSLTLAKEHPQPVDRLMNAVLRDQDIRQNGDSADCRLSVELLLESCRRETIQAVESAQLDTENPFSLADFPTLTLVRVDDESLWELAKRYHSSVERIEELNDLNGALQGRLLMIPKQL